MKIAYVIDSLDGIHGGSERQLYNLVCGMFAQGHQVTLYVLRHTEFTRHLAGFPCSVRSLDVHSVLRATSLGTLWRFRQELVATGVDIVHGFFNDVALILPPLLLGTGIRTYTSRRDMGIWYTRRNLLLLRLYRFTPTRIICNSHAVARHTQQFEKAPDPNLSVIYNGLEATQDKSAQVVANWAPQRETDPSVIHVVLVANVRTVKRIEDLVMAASLLRDSTWRFRYHIVGSLQEPDYYQSLVRLVDRQQLKSAFNFVGKVTNPRTGLSQFDIGVITSESEGLSNTIMEYLSVGLPVVVSNVGGNPELITHGHNGLLYPMGDSSALAECLLQLAANRSLREKIAANAILRSEDFGMEKMIDRYENEYAGTSCGISLS